MSLIALLVVLVVIGVVLQMFPIDPQFKKLIIAVAVIVTLIVILYAVAGGEGLNWGWRRVP